MPSLPDTEPPSDPQVAALVAINIVTQVLDAAEDILNIANDSGKSWRHVWRQKKSRGMCCDNDEILGISDFKVDDSDINNTEVIESDNVIVTSTPQKEIGHITKTYNESGYIGQGDENIETRNIDLRSPSMLINCLFDMSDLEQDGTIQVFDDIDIVGSESRNLAINSIAKLVESYINAALNTVCDDVVISKYEVDARLEGSSYSSYSMLPDALISDDTENDNTVSYIGKSEVIPISVKMEYEYSENVKEITKNDVDVYEKTYLTLNRDYEKYSEEEEDFSADVKNLTMQEVELTANKNSDDITQYPEATEPIVRKEEGPISSRKVLGCYKRSLVKRCRLQGAKLFSRLRNWWWRQSIIGKRKACRSGMCPLSPEVRNRTGSLLDHRKLRSPSPSGMAAWKFNTVNEGLIHSYNIKDFELDINNVPIEKD